MADFCTEYCQKYDNNLPGDFSVIEIFETLKPNYFISQICEGFGFSAISNFDNRCEVAFINYDTDEIKWIEFKNIDKDTHRNIWKQTT